MNMGLCSEEPSLDTGSVWKAMGAKLKKINVSLNGHSFY